MKYITCFSCGRQNIPETEEYCPQCGFGLYVPEYPGAASDESVDLNSQPATDYPNSQAPMGYPNNQATMGFQNNRRRPIIMSKREPINAWDVIGIFAGIIVMIIGISTIISVEDVTFKGDFYTEIYKAAAICARGIFALFALSGLGMIIQHGKSIVSRKYE